MRKKGLMLIMAMCLLIATNGCVHLLGAAVITGKSVVSGVSKKVAPKPEDKTVTSKTPPTSAPDIPIFGFAPTSYDF